MTAIYAGIDDILRGPPEVDEITRAWLVQSPSAETRRACATVLRSWWGWVDANHPRLPVARVTGEHVAAWRDDALMTRAPSTIAQRLTLLTSWFDALNRAGVTAGNPARHVKRPPVSGEGVTRAPAPADVVKVLEWVDENEAVGIAIGVQLAARYALRVGELAALHVDDVLSDSAGRCLLRVRVKGGGRATVHVGEPLRTRLLRYIEGRSAGPLLQVGTAGITARMVARALERAERATGVPHIHPHMLRVHAITVALDAGHSLEAVAHFARHAKVDTTRRYDRNPGRRDDEIAADIAATLDTIASAQYSDGVKGTDWADVIVPPTPDDDDPRIEPPGVEIPPEHDAGPFIGYDPDIDYDTEGEPF